MSSLLFFGLLGERSKSKEEWVVTARRIGGVGICRRKGVMSGILAKE